MKKMKISTRMFFGFGTIISLLIILVFAQYLMIDGIQLRKNLLINATEINKSTQNTQQWVLDYYDSNSADAVENFSRNYNITKSYIEEGGGYYKDQYDLKILTEMSRELDLYSDYFFQYKDYIESNRECVTDMDAAINDILKRLNLLIVLQKNDFQVYVDNTKYQSNNVQINSQEFISQILNEYEEVAYSNGAIQSIYGAMVAELRYILNEDEHSDLEVYHMTKELKLQCNWLYDNFNRESDKIKIEEISIA